MKYVADIDRFLDRFIGVPMLVLLGGLCSKEPPDAITSSSASLIRRILLIQISAIGDVVLLTPALKSIRKRFPDALISMICSPLNSQILRRCSYLDELIVLDIADIKDLPRFVKFISQMRKRRFDISVDFEHWPRLTAILSWMVGAKRRIGFQAELQHRHYAFTDVVAHLRGRHEVHTFMDLVKILGCDSKECELEIWLDESDVSWAKSFFQENQLDSNRPVVAIHPDAGRGQPRRRWDLDGYAKVAQALNADYGAQIIITGSPAEVNVAQRLASMMEVRPLMAAGLTDISRLAALLAKCDLLLCGNCGPMHLAAAVKTPVVAIHGPTNPLQWGPWGEGHIVLKPDMPCHPCLNLGFEYGCKALADGTSMCLHTIPYEEVIRACRKQLSRKFVG